MQFVHMSGLRTMNELVWFFIENIHILNCFLHSPMQQSAGRRLVMKHITIGVKLTHSVPTKNLLDFTFLPTTSSL